MVYEGCQTRLRVPSVSATWRVSCCVSEIRAPIYQRSVEEPDVEDRSRLFPGISTRRSMARAMDVSYATAFPTENS